MLLLMFALALLHPAAASQPVGMYELAYPYPSADGTRIAFQGNFDGRWQLYEITTEDGAVRRLHISPGDDTHPALSPDGRRLAFISNREGNDDVWLLDLKTGEARTVAPHPGKDGHPKWSADGEWLVFNRTFDPNDKEGDIDSAILRVRADGSGLETISDSSHIETFASFSPDGRSIAFVEWFPDAAGTPARNGEIILVDIASRRRRNLTNSPGFDGYPFWGASGEWVYFSTAAQGPKGREAAVHRVNVSSGAVERLTPLDGMNEVRAIPAADEDTLWFNQEQDGRTLIHRMEITPAETVEAD